MGKVASEQPELRVQDKGNISRYCKLSAYRFLAPFARQANLPRDMPIRDGEFSPFRPGLSAMIGPGARLADHLIITDHIVCLEDGAKLKMLKRHLASHHNMTPAEYRTKWKLAAAYPLVARNYADQRKSLALKIGLGRKPVEAGTAAKSAAEKPAAKRKLSIKFAHAEPASSSASPKHAARKKADAPAA